MHIQTMASWQHGHVFLGEQHARNERKTWFVIGLTATMMMADVAPEDELAAAIRERLETGGDRISDLHLWQIGAGHVSAIIALVTHAPRPPNTYKAMLAGLEGLSHLTVEVQACEGCACR